MLWRRKAWSCTASLGYVWRSAQGTALSTYVVARSFAASRNGQARKPATATKPLLRRLQQRASMHATAQQTVTRHSKQSLQGVIWQLHPWFQSGTIWSCCISPYSSMQSMRFALSSLPSGLVWSNPWLWLPSKHFTEWALRPAHNARVAIINAMYTAGGNVHRMLPIMLAESLRQDGFAACLAGDRGRYRVQVPASSALIPWLSPLLKGILQLAADIARLLQLMLLFAPVVCWAPMALSYGIKRPQWLQLFRRTLEVSGPAFIKWGQWAATRRDMFPADLCKELCLLHTQAPVHPMHFTCTTIRHAFNAEVEDLFDGFEAEPVASGSIAQVYRARLSSKGAAHTGMEEGTQVAVKVRHPGVVKSIQRDFALMLQAAKLVAIIPAIGKMRPEETLAQFAAPLQEQVDLSLEAQHLQRFNYNFRHDVSIQFPSPVYPLVAPEVLVESFEEGEGISRYVSDETAASPHDKQLAMLGHRVMLQMMLKDNFIHSDLHPGNIMVRLEPPANPLLRSASHLSCKLRQWASGRGESDGWLQPRIVLLDAGMVTRMSGADQHNMLQLFRAFTQKDGQGVANAILQFSGEQQTCVQPAAFAEAMQHHFAKMPPAGASWSEGHFSSASDALSAVLDLVRQHEVTMPGHICAIIATTLVLEGWSSTLDPVHSIMDDVDTAINGSAGWDKKFRLAVKSYGNDLKARVC